MGKVDDNVSRSRRLSFKGAKSWHLDYFGQENSKKTESNSLPK